MIWVEDYYYLAASNAKLEKEKEALKYLRKAIEKGWQKDNIDEQSEWKTYKHNLEFIQIIQ
jgi:hypothetical protein